MPAEFASRWWSLLLPEDWEAEDGEVCSFIKRGGSGGLQISSHRKKGALVTRADLEQFAGRNCPPGSTLLDAVFGQFRGLCFERADRERYTLYWWVSCKDVLLFITYNSKKPDCSAEVNEVRALLNSLTMRSS